VDEEVGVVDGVDRGADVCRGQRGASARIEVVMPSGVTLRVAETVDPMALVRIVHALESVERC